MKFAIKKIIPNFFVHNITKNLKKKHWFWDHIMDVQKDHK
jgi:hypothetical protein